MLRLLLLVGLLCGAIGCAQQPTEIIIPQTDNQEFANDPTRIEFAVFGKLKDKFKGLGGRRGGDEGSDCEGGNCPAPQQPNIQPRQEPAFDPSLVAAPLGIGFCLLLGLGTFLGVRSLQER